MYWHSKWWLLSKLIVLSKLDISHIMVSTHAYVDDICTRRPSASAPPCPFDLKTAAREVLTAGAKPRQDIPRFGSECDLDPTSGLWTRPLSELVCQSASAQTVAMTSLDCLPTLFSTSFCERLKVLYRLYIYRKTSGSILTWTYSVDCSRHEIYFTSIE
ncbi:hypothetical protein GQ602_000973 [Ophiocordyceps camponoti-floridani]|uniref:Uncharacterized protein n=1 Tax=Ophiocordyceps camponoti-floridani TaxID=2030778 RepID=A0A8H4QD65_9HYPO|nr:hypothetical protein GQ602_000973 [Ophiocordyceps camponoti-floridani]